MGLQKKAFAYKTLARTGTEIAVLAVHRVRRVVTNATLLLRLSFHDITTRIQTRHTRQLDIPQT